MVDNPDKYEAYDEPDGSWIKEPGSFSGTSFHDIMPVEVPAGAMLAARLCNFPSGKWSLRTSHQNWLNTFVGPALSSLSWPWVDLIGYASQLPDVKLAGGNYELSVRRVNSVKSWISNYSSTVHWNLQMGKGSSVSSTFPTNNDGLYRAVEVFVYGYKPPTVTPATVVGFKDFAIRCLGGVTLTPGDLIDSDIPLAVGAQGYVFEITAYSVAKPVQKAQYLFASGTIPLPSLPWFPGVGLGGSSSGAGGMSPFHTSLPVELKDFQGTMTIHQRPGISLAGGNLEVDMASDALARLGAVVLPSRMLWVEASSSWSSPASLGSAGIPGQLKMRGTTKPL
jgi:hypothetical protein